MAESFERIESRDAYFNASEDSEWALITAEATDKAEVSLAIRSLTDWTGKKKLIGATAYLAPVEAVILGRALIEAARAAK